MWEFIRELQNEGATLLLTTQYLEEADQLADKIAVIDLGTVIAEGTSDELKDRIGGEVLELQVADPADADRAAAALVGIGNGDPYVDEKTCAIRVPVGDRGPAAALESTRRLDDLQIQMSGFALHRPTLDDVFLSLTGHVAEDTDGENPAKKERRGRERRREA